jgi:predicted O-linked N-acetylglucosamine transferase (SPINDLY family)
MTGRNDPCPCGSGKKFKKCHGLSITGPENSPANKPLVSASLEQCRLLFERKQFDGAWQAAQQLPESAQTCRVRVDILVARRGAGDLENATSIIEQWKRLAPADPEPWSRTLEIALNAGNKTAQSSALRKLQAMAPQNARTLYYQGLLAQLDGQIGAALEYLAAAARKQFPAYRPLSWNVMAASRAFDIATGKYPGSGTSSYSQLLGHPEVIEALKRALQTWNGRHARELETLDTEQRTVVASAWQKLSIAGMQGLIDLQEVHAYNEAALRLNPNLLSARSSELFCLNYDDTLSAEEIYRQHCAWGDWMASTYPPRTRRFLNSRKASRPLKVAYLSSDFYQHPVAYFILPVLQNHNSQHVRSYLYHTREAQDDFTRKFVAAAGQFLAVWDYDDRALASQMERDGIDILVDLNGASSGHRMTLLSQRAAPVQITWLGYPNTTGLASVDYRIVDGVTDPPPGAAALNREKLLYLPRLFSVYDPITPLPDVSPAPFEQNGHITFGSFNNINKLTDRQLSLWAAVLQQVPDSRLLFKYPTLEFNALRESLLRRMQAAGIRPERIHFQGLAPGRDEHLQAFANIDIHLDSFPYHGTTTSCESLVMGVPVVTLAGREHRCRVGASLLHSLDCDHWVAHSPEEYIRIAAQLAADKPALANTRAGLRSRMQASALMDAGAFVTDLERAYQQCWEHWCRGSGPVA